MPPEATRSARPVAVRAFRTLTVRGTEPEIVQGTRTKLRGHGRRGRGAARLRRRAGRAATRPKPPSACSGSSPRSRTTRTATPRRRPELHAGAGRLSARRARDGGAAQRGPRPHGRPPLAASPLEAVEGVEEEVGARQVARRGRLVAPAHDRVGADHDERPLREAARVQHAEGAAGGALGLEVRELLDRDAELLLERLLGPDRVAGDAVERRAALGEVAEQLVVDAQLVGADRREGERVEDQDRRPALEVGARERLSREASRA